MTTIFIVFLLIGTMAFFLILRGISMYSYNKKQDEVRDAIDELTSKSDWQSAEDFLEMRSVTVVENKHRKGVSGGQDFTGVYILHNETKDMYYVGQGKNVLQRISNHLAGRGNGDVYADFKYGDRFSVKAIQLADSGYASIDDLERDTIATYDAYNNGYNRTRGNHRG